MILQDEERIKQLKCDIYDAACEKNKWATIAQQKEAELIRLITEIENHKQIQANINEAQK